MWMGWDRMCKGMKERNKVGSKSSISTPPPSIRVPNRKKGGVIGVPNSGATVRIIILLLPFNSGCRE